MVTQRRILAGVKIFLLGDVADNLLHFRVVQRRLDGVIIELGNVVLPRLRVALFVVDGYIGERDVASATFKSVRGHVLKAWWPIREQHAELNAVTFQGDAVNPHHVSVLYKFFQILDGFAKADAVAVCTLRAGGAVIRNVNPVPTVIRICAHRLFGEHFCSAITQAGSETGEFTLNEFCR
jgi:hypothetical protein